MEGFYDSDAKPLACRTQIIRSADYSWATVHNGITDLILLIKYGGQF